MGLDRAHRIGVIGAGGFIGARLMRIGRQRNCLEVVAIVRSAKSLARLSNAPFQTRIIDTSNVSSLAEALSDCDTAINLAHGDVSRTVDETKTIYNAVSAAGCKLLVHLSSAIVYGRADHKRLDDDSPPDVHHWMLYARGKAQAELFLARVLAETKLRTVILRPGIVWGPGSHWVRFVGEELSSGEIFLCNGGSGVANLIYVDNLCRMMLQIHDRSDGPSGFYNVSDPELISWADYYRAIAIAAGYGTPEIRTNPSNRLPVSSKVILEWLLQRRQLYQLCKRVLPRLPVSWKGLAKTMLQGERRPPMRELKVAVPTLSREHWDLQNTHTQLRSDKFLRHYGPLSLLTFADGVKASAAWLRFAGYGNELILKNA